MPGVAQARDTDDRPAVAVPCSIMRGGTSRGVLVRAEDLASDEAERARQILTIFGSPHPYQLDGVGGASAQTSKLAVLGRPTRPEADIDYTFAQIGINETTIDQTGTCGNLSAAAALFAVEEGLVGYTPGRATTVRLHNTNTGELIVADVSRPGGGRPAAGHPGAVYLDYSDMAAGGEWAIFVTGRRRTKLPLADGSRIEASLCNVGNAMVYVRASDIGITGREDPAALDADPVVAGRLRLIRQAAAPLLSEAGVPGLSSANTRLPLVTIVAPPDAGDTDETGELVDIVVRLHAVGRTHLALAGSAAVSLGAAISFPDNVAADCARRLVSDGTLRIRHPSGVLRVDVRRDGESGFERLAYERTARRIMDGIAYV